MIKISYVILDSENRWHSTGSNATPEQLRAEIANVTERLAKEGETPEELIIYEVKGEPTVIKLNK